VLLLDEPFAALDAQTRIVIENDVVRICREGKRTMLLVTHDISEAISMADRVVVLTKRPARVKAVFEIPFSRTAKSVADVPGMVEFTTMFRRVWDELEISVPGTMELAS
jgi:NitT/TauT family transport system ATP-binding protein